ncbi:ATP-grasp domain-containing protein [Kitasatospora sp. NPDC056531]|uniref:ATP-grasp domain-containing protein n=1 Tax=Kitasatospora sp. NPDC056531 TaxID=3345856 RepID=UPI0036CD557C
MRRVAVLGGTEAVLEAAAEAGVTVVLLQHPGLVTPRARQLCEQVVEADLDDVAAVTAAVAGLHRRRPFDRVLSLTEPCLVLATELNHLLGLPGNLPQVSRALKDKHAMRVLMAAAGLSPVRFRIVSSLAECRDFRASVGGRIVVKPPRGAGSLGVCEIASDEAERGYWQHDGAACAGPRLAEEFLVGREISVETVSHRGRHLVLAITEKELGPGFVEIGHYVPARISRPEHEAAAGAAVRFLTAVGLSEGPAHTEIILTADGPRIVESHDRIGGGNLATVVRLAHGVDLVRWALTVPLGLEALPEHAPEATGGAAVRFIVPEPGVVSGIAGLDAARGVPDTTLHFPLAVGATVPQLRSSLDRVNGHVIGRGPDTRSAVSRCEEVLAALRVDTAPGPRPAAATGARPAE